MSHSPLIHGVARVTDGPSDRFGLPATGSFRVDFHNEDPAFFYNVVLESAVMPNPVGGVVVRTPNDGALVRLVSKSDLRSIERLSGR